MKSLMTGLLAAFALTTGAGAQAMGPFQVYEQALRKDPVFLGALKAREAGQENRAIGRAGLLPSLSYNYNKGRNDSKARYLGDSRREDEDRHYNSYGSTFILQQPLLDYEAYASYRKGVAQALFADEEFRGKSQELLVRVMTSYTQALFAEDQISISVASKQAINSSSSRTSNCSSRVRAPVPIFSKPRPALSWPTPRRSRHATIRMRPCASWVR